MEKFIITKKQCGKFQVQLRSNAGQILLSSEEYLTKISCKRVIEKLRTFAKDSGKLQKKTTVDWELYFYLKSDSGKAIAISKKYSTNLSREQAITRVRKIAPFAPVEDQC